MKEELRVRYTIEGGIDPEFDHDLIALARMHGWHFWASGCHLNPTGERDLAFDREEVAEPIDIGCKPPAGSLEALTYYCGED